MAEPLLRVDNLVRRYGGITATDNLSMEVVPGELHAIMGPNGAGKTTLISQLTGQVMPNSGTIRFAGRDVTGLPSYKRSRLGLARSFQITSLLKDFSAIDMSRWPRRRMTATRSGSGAMRARRPVCARPRAPRWSASASASAPTSWSRS